MGTLVRFNHAGAASDLETVRGLFLEYANSLNFSLCFQNFDQEVANLPGAYSPPHGRLILCEVNGLPAGCIALRPLEPGVCEMKRLFVRPEFRGQHLGLQLTRYIIDEARKIGYRTMRLDTLRGRMDNAIALYRSVGFNDIPPYRENPLPEALYMELKL